MWKPALQIYPHSYFKSLAYIFIGIKIFPTASTAGQQSWLRESLEVVKHERQDIDYPVHLQGPIVTVLRIPWPSLTSVLCVRMLLCTCVCTCVCTYACVCICVHMCLHACIYAHACASARVRAHVQSRLALNGFCGIRIQVLMVAWQLL